MREIDPNEQLDEDVEEVCPKFNCCFIVSTSRSCIFPVVALKFHERTAASIIWKCYSVESYMINGVTS